MSFAWRPSKKKAGQQNQGRLMTCGGKGGLAWAEVHSSAEQAGDKVALGESGSAEMERGGENGLISIGRVPM